MTIYTYDKALSEVMKHRDVISAECEELRAANATLAEELARVRACASAWKTTGRRSRGMLNIYRVDLASGSPYPTSDKSVLVVAENYKDAEDVVMRNENSLFAWSSGRKIARIELIPGRVLVGSPVAFAVAKEAHDEAAG